MILKKIILNAADVDGLVVTVVGVALRPLTVSRSVVVVDVDGHYLASRRMFFFFEKAI